MIRTQPDHADHLPVSMGQARAHTRTANIEFAGQRGQCGQLDQPGQGEQEVHGLVTDSLGSLLDQLLPDLIQDWRYQFHHRMAVCEIDGASAEEAFAVAALQIGEEAIHLLRLDLLPDLEHYQSKSLSRVPQPNVRTHDQMDDFRT